MRRAWINPFISQTNKIVKLLKAHDVQVGDEVELRLSFVTSGETIFSRGALLFCLVCQIGSSVTFIHKEASGIIPPTKVHAEGTFYFDPSDLVGKHLILPAIITRRGIILNLSAAQFVERESARRFTVRPSNVQATNLEAVTT